MALDMVTVKVTRCVPFSVGVSLRFLLLAEAGLLEDSLKYSAGLESSPPPAAGDADVSCGSTSGVPAVSVAASSSGVLQMGTTGRVKKKHHINVTKQYDPYYLCGKGSI